MHVIWHTVIPRHFNHQFENKYNLFWVEEVSVLANELCYCLDITVIHTIKKTGHLVQWHCNFYTGSFKWLGVLINIDILGIICFSLWAGYRFSLKNTNRFIVYSRICTGMCLCSKLLFICDLIFFIKQFTAIGIYWRCIGRISGAARSLPVFFTKCVWSANSVGHVWWVMILFCICWNYYV